jgi:hypothetical protein
VIVGVIEIFDEQRGDGWFVAETGERLYFHCVAIKDGSRSIPTGVRATGIRAVGRLGRDELIDLVAF